MTETDELRYQVKQLQFEKENLKRQLVAAMKFNKKMYEKEVELNEIIRILKKQNEEPI